MDRAFMGQYFDIAYEDIITELIQDCPEYQKIRDEISAEQRELFSLVGDIKSDVWQQYETVIGKFHSSELLLAKLAYLRGAADREKMLR